MKKLILDTNIIISALLKDSITREIIFHFSGELYFVSFSKEEIQKYEEYLCIKTKKDKEELNKIFKNLLNKLRIIDDNIVNTKIDEASKIMDKIDADDTPFIAAALAIEADIWSDDKHFEKQNIIKVWKTSEIYKIFTEE